MCYDRFLIKIKLVVILDCSQSPIFPWDRLDIRRLTVTAIMIFKCTEGAGVGDYGSAGGGGGQFWHSCKMILRKNRGLWTVYCYTSEVNRSMVAMLLDLDFSSLLRFITMLNLSRIWLTFIDTRKMKASLTKDSMISWIWRDGKKYSRCFIAILRVLISNLSVFCSHVQLLGNLSVDYVSDVWAKEIASL